MKNTITTKPGQQVWRFTVTSMTEIEIPKGAQFLSVRIGHGDPVVKSYWLVDPQAEKETRYLTAVTAGETLPEGATYLATEAMTGAHIFELPAAFATK